MLTLLIVLHLFALLHTYLIMQNEALRIIAKPGLSLLEMIGYILDSPTVRLGLFLLIVFLIPEEKPLLPPFSGFGLLLMWGLNLFYFRWNVGLLLSAFNNYVYSVRERRILGAVNGVVFLILLTAVLLLHV